MSVLRPLYVEHYTLVELGQEIDRIRREEVGEHVLKSISHAVAPDPTAPSGFRYSAVLILELPG